MPGIKIGKIGLEKTFENKLLGTNDIERYEVNAYGKRINHFHAKDVRNEVLNSLEKRLYDLENDPREQKNLINDPA